MKKLLLLVFLVPSSLFALTENEVYLESDANGTKLKFFYSHITQGANLYKTRNVAEHDAILAKLTGEGRAFTTQLITPDAEFVAISTSTNMSLNNFEDVRAYIGDVSMARERLVSLYVRLRALIDMSNDGLPVNAEIQRVRGAIGIMKSRLQKI